LSQAESTCTISPVPSTPGLFGGSQWKKIAFQAETPRCCPQPQPTYK
jgi:hypothetical protein